MSEAATQPVRNLPGPPPNVDPGCPDIRIPLTHDRLAVVQAALIELVAQVTGGLVTGANYRRAALLIPMSGETPLFISHLVLPGDAHRRRLSGAKDAATRELLRHLSTGRMPINSYLTFDPLLLPYHAQSRVRRAMAGRFPDLAAAASNIMAEDADRARREAHRLAARWTEQALPALLRA